MFSSMQRIPVWWFQLLRIRMYRSSNICRVKVRRLQRLSAQRKIIMKLARISCQNKSIQRQMLLRIRRKRAQNLFKSPNKRSRQSHNKNMGQQLRIKRMLWVANRIGARSSLHSNSKCRQLVANRSQPSRRARTRNCRSRINSRRMIRKICSQRRRRLRGNLIKRMPIRINTSLKSKICSSKTSQSRLKSPQHPKSKAKINVINQNNSRKARMSKSLNNSRNNKLKPKKHHS